MIKLILVIFYLSTIACVTNRQMPDEPKPPAVEPQDEVIPVIEKPSTLNRTIKDHNLKKADADKSPRKRVVVLPFLDRNSSRPFEILNQARADFMNELNRTQELVALDSSELKIDLSTFLKNGEYDLKAMAQATQNSGVSSLLESKVIDVRFKTKNDADLQTGLKKAVFEIVVKARMVSVRTGQELFNTVKTVTLEEENTKLSAQTPSETFFNKNPLLVQLLIKDAFLDFTGQLADSMNQVIWEGRIAALQGEKIYLNVGQVSGLQVGDILKVVEDGNEVYDPEIGYHIGKVPGKVKGTLEVVGYFGQDGAVGVIHSGANFKENDRIELYE